MPRRALRLSVAVLLAGLVAGCFQPLHAPRGGPALGLKDTLSQVSVMPIDGYLGYTLKSELDFLLTGGTPAKNSRYILTVKLYQDRGSSIIDAATARAQNVTVQAQAVYELKDTKNGKILSSGKTFASSAFDRSQQRFATTRALRDAEQRLGKALAERLRIILQADLAKDTLPSAPPAPALTPFPDPLDEERAGDPGNET